MSKVNRKPKKMPDPLSTGRRRRKYRPLYRICTKPAKGNGPFHELAFGENLAQLKAVEWAYIVEQLPPQVPWTLPPAARVLWLVAHFSQLAVEADPTVAQRVLEHTEADAKARFDVRVAARNRLLEGGNVRGHTSAAVSAAAVGGSSPPFLGMDEAQGSASGKGSPERPTIAESDGALSGRRGAHVVDSSPSPILGPSATGSSGGGSSDAAIQKQRHHLQRAATITSIGRQLSDASGGSSSTMKGDTAPSTPRAAAAEQMEGGSISLARQGSNGSDVNAATLPRSRRIQDDLGAGSPSSKSVTKKRPTVRRRASFSQEGRFHHRFTSDGRRTVRFDSGADRREQAREAATSVASPAGSKKNVERTVSFGRKRSVSSGTLLNSAMTPFFLGENGQKGITGSTKVFSKRSATTTAADVTEAASLACDSFGKRGTRPNRSSSTVARLSTVRFLKELRGSGGGVSAGDSASKALSPTSRVGGNSPGRKRLEVMVEEDCSSDLGALEVEKGRQGVSALTVSPVPLQTVPPTRARGNGSGGSTDNSGGSANAGEKVSTLSARSPFVKKQHSPESKGAPQSATTSPQPRMALVGSDAELDELDFDEAELLAQKLAIRDENSSGDDNMVKRLETLRRFVSRRKKTVRSYNAASLQMHGSSSSIQRVVSDASVATAISGVQQGLVPGSQQISLAGGSAATVAPVELSGTTFATMAFLFANLGLLLVRDSSVVSFIAMMVVLNVALFGLIIMGVPMSLAVAFKIRRGAIGAVPPDGNGAGVDGHAKTTDVDAGLMAQSGVESLPESMESVELLDVTTPLSQRGLLKVDVLPADLSAIMEDEEDEELARWQAVLALVPDRPITLPIEHWEADITAVNSAFDIVGVDIFRSAKKLCHVASEVVLPFVNEELVYGDDDDSSSESEAEGRGDSGQTRRMRARTKSFESREQLRRAMDAPTQYDKVDMFVVNMQVPLYAPSSGVDDGESVSLVLYFTRNGRQRNAKMDKNLSRFFSAVPLGGPHAGDHDDIAQLRMVPMFHFEEDEFDYNEDGYDQNNDRDEVRRLPAAVRREIEANNQRGFRTGLHTHTVYRGDRYVEVDIDFHKFSESVRRVLFQTTPHVSSLAVDIAFVLDGGDTEAIAFPKKDAFAAVRLRNISLAYGVRVASLYRKGASGSALEQAALKGVLSATSRQAQMTMAAASAAAKSFRQNEDGGSLDLEQDSGSSSDSDIEYA